jgi:selenocysteine lyase/cysteine desulfurase
MPRLGYECITPTDSPSSIAAFVVKDEQSTTTKLAKAKVDVTIRDSSMRVSPSIYNTDADIDQLLNALS